MPIDPNRMMSEHPNMTDLLLWLDSCVGENRDSNDGLCPAVFSATKKNQRPSDTANWATQTFRTLTTCTQSSKET